MAEPVKTKMMHDIADTETGQTRVTIYSVTGQPRTKEEFSTAYKAWEEGNEGKMKDFAFLEPGALNNARKAFETVSQPVKQVVGKVSSGIGQVASYSPALALAAKVGLIPKGTASNVSQVGGEVASDIATAPFATPEDTAGTLGAIGGLRATRGMGGLTGNIIKAGATGLGTMLGRITGSTATGTGPKFEEALTAGLIATATEGGIGAFKAVTGYGLSQRAQEKVAGKIMDLTKGELRGIMDDPKALERFASTREGMATLLQEGLNGLRGDMKQQADAVLMAVSKRSPHTLSRTHAHELRTVIDEFQKTSGEMLENVADKKSKNASLAKLNALQGKMEDVVKDAFSKASPAKQSEIILDLGKSVLDMHEYTKKFERTAELFGALTRSSAHTGFNAGAYQREIAEYFAQNPQGLIKESAKLAFRGASPLGGSDSPLMNRKRIGIPGIRALGVDIGPLGQRYVGKTDTMTGAIAEGLTGQAAIKSFFGGKEE